MVEYVDEDYLEKNNIKILYIDFLIDSGYQTNVATCGSYGFGTDIETIDSAEGALRNQYFKDYDRRLHPVDKGKNKEQLIEYSKNFLLKKFRVLNNNNNQIFKKENENYMWLKDSVKKESLFQTRRRRLF